MRLFRGIRMSWLQGDFPLRWWWFIATPHLVIGKRRKPGARPGREENSCSSGHLWPSWLNRRGLILCCLLQKSGAGLSSSPEAEGHVEKQLVLSPWHVPWGPGATRPAWKLFSWRICPMLCLHGNKMLETPIVLLKDFTWSTTGSKIWPLWNDPTIWVFRQDFYVVRASVGRQVGGATGSNLEATLSRGYGSWKDAFFPSTSLVAKPIAGLNHKRFCKWWL